MLNTVPAHSQLNPQARATAPYTEPENPRDHRRETRAYGMRLEEKHRRELRTRKC